MRWKDTLILRLRSLFRRARVEDELDTELQFHLQEQVEEHVAAGGLAAMSRVGRMSGVLEGETARQVLMLQLVCGEYFPVLGLMPALGRFLRPDDNLTVGGHPVAVISKTMWRRRFAAAPDVVG